MAAEGTVGVPTCFTLNNVQVSRGYLQCRLLYFRVLSASGLNFESQNRVCLPPICTAFILVSTVYLPTSRLLILARLFNG
jgi:hypothetical protein